MDALDRLFSLLVEIVRRQDADPSALTIAEIYQHLVPYRTVRSEIGLGELAEYEHALMRLLSGERGYAEVGLLAVREELREELRSPNPILGLYRDYAAVDVALNTDAAVAARPAPPPPAPSKAAAPPARPVAVPSAPVPQPRPLAAPSAPVPQPAPPSVPREAPAKPVNSCRGCRARLPDGKDVRFCPHCGVVQKPVPCHACGVDVEPEWKYCVGCGVPRRTPGSARE